ncbi:hypothetical protein ACQP2U_04140 [Nocardia sp. CA-084685]|uniref:hypothetical protein n=1 Tax=Nocardia sp. CA-084685 TaxID=3239970 RepID=UPI003D967F7F
MQTNDISAERDKATVDTEGLENVVDWADYYRQQFHLPAEERGGYVMLPVTNHLGIVHIPKLLAEKVRISLLRQGTLGPLLARQIRWTFVAAVDYAPGRQVLELLARKNICVPVVGSALMIPTSLGRWTREGAHWINPPDRDQSMPMLSTVISTTLAAISDRSDRPASSWTG